jgi:hypothetical protein
MISDGVVGNSEGKQNTGQAQIIQELYNRLRCFFRRFPLMLANAEFSALKCI